VCVHIAIPEARSPEVDHGHRLLKGCGPLIQEPLEVFQFDIQKVLKLLQAMFPKLRIYRTQSSSPVRRSGDSCCCWVRNPKALSLEIPVYSRSVAQIGDR
jgi:hypothetical protein